MAEVTNARAVSVRASISRESENEASAAQVAGDHQINRNGLSISLKNYPEDTPKLSVQWYHAIDVAKRKPKYLSNPSPADEKPAGIPKKFLPFSAKDSRAIEAAFQKISEEEERIEVLASESEATGGDLSTQKIPNRRQSLQDPTKNTKVSVNEDYLFDVDIPTRELAPAYWLGPVYEVRRGTWFFQEGSNLRPCDENLAIQLEEGYLKTKPWRLPQQHKRSASQPPREAPSTSKQLPNSPEIPHIAQVLPSSLATRKQSAESLNEKSVSDNESTSNTGKDRKELQPPQFLTHRLFGSHMNSMVTYQDSTVAWLVTDNNMLSRVTGNMYQRFAGGAHFSGTRVIRGYTEAIKKKPSKDPKISRTPEQEVGLPDKGSPNRYSLQSQPASDDLQSASNFDAEAESAAETSESRVTTLEKQMTSLVSQDLEQREEEVRKREEQEIRDDYRDLEGDDQSRQIEHLILITHGIGQRLGVRFESFNFIHDVNEFRKALKTIYNSAEDLQALNAELEKLPKNCRIQVLPICWRHLLDFPNQGKKEARKEQDLGDMDATEEEHYPSLDDITIEGVPALRNIVADLALDVLLYQTISYRDHIARIVASECNRIHKLFLQRNPTFSGKVSLLGHSLGSAIMFDILCEQQYESALSEDRQKSRRAEELDLTLDFAVENFFCFGSPLGLFQMLAGRTIGGRTNPNKVTLDGSADEIEDPYQGSIYSKTTGKSTTSPGHHDVSISRPKCEQMYNIFHPTDPISYRLEPLISPAMASLKPQPLPYTKKGLFGAPMGQGLTALPARVTQGFSGLWTSFSSGIASSLLNKSLGISAEDANKMSQPQLMNQRIEQSVGAGTNISTGGVIAPNHLTSEMNALIDGTELSGQGHQNMANAGGNPEHPPTLIDGEMETLWGGFQKRKKSIQDSDFNMRDLGAGLGFKDAEERGRKLKREESKVRALNSNGRVDYSIQEGAFDISFLASIASHLSYWTDEDVAHFMTSQLLSRNRLIQRSPSTKGSR